MGFQEMNKLHHHHDTRVEDDQGGWKKASIWVLPAGGIVLPPRPVKVGRRRRQSRQRGGATEEEEDEVTTPRGKGCRLPVEAETCPPAPKKPRTAAVSIVAGRRCNPDDGEPLEFFRVPEDLESVFSTRVDKAN